MNQRKILCSGSRSLRQRPPLCLLMDGDDELYGSFIDTQNGLIERSGNSTTDSFQGALQCEQVWVARTCKCSSNFNGDSYHQLPINCQQQVHRVDDRPGLTCPEVVSRLAVTPIFIICGQGAGSAVKVSV
uniref:Uncharacterized protein n=1 Tax=Rhabditophanes sp. KR3021 TaxID=114890 RepID=A0AC35UDE2_9BILA